MNAVMFDKANTIYKAPGCFDLPAHKEEHSITSCWQPSDKEMEYIKKCIENDTKPNIYLSLLSQVQVPVWLGCDYFEEESENE